MPIWHGISTTSAATSLRVLSREARTTDLERAPRSEAMRIHFHADDRLDTLWLQLKPTFSLSWAMVEW